MKIQFISNYSDLYGANRSLLSIIKYFHKKGHFVNVILPSQGEMGESLKKEKISYQVIPYYSAFLYIKPILKHVLVPILGVLNIITFPIFVFKINKFNPDIIYSNTSAENLGIFAARILKKKHIIHVREFMSLDYNSFFIFGKKTKQQFINLSDGAIFVSKSVKKSIFPNILISSKHKVIYNGISAPNKSLDDKPLPNITRFGIVGILDPAKRQYKAIEYFKKILQKKPQSELHIFGDKKGKYKIRILKLIEKLEIEKSVYFHGFERDINKIYESIDVLFMFSKSEGFGRVTVEAMLRGIPVIGFDNGGTGELIENKKTGYLFQNKEIFYQSIDELLDSNKSFNSIRINAFNYAIKAYDEFTYCENIENFVLKILKH